MVVTLGCYLLLKDAIIRCYYYYSYDLEDQGAARPRAQRLARGDLAGEAQQRLLIMILILIIIIIKMITIITTIIITTI